jgi:broad specificity phosphatase PhoE
MTIYFLRHEERDMSNPLFNSQLTDNGKHNANNNLPNTLKKLNIKTIYCSPFLRTLQTIQQFSKEANISINIEPAISEYIHNDKFKDNDNFKIEYNEEFNINKEYSSYQNINTIKYKENEIELKKRTHKFLSYLSGIYDNNDNILLVSHMGTINAMLDYFIPTDFYFKFDMGKVSKIENNKIVFIN